MRLAGVSEATLLEVSAPQEEEDKPQAEASREIRSIVGLSRSSSYVQLGQGELKNGSTVEIHGLESETGKQLNGQADLSKYYVSQAKVGTITSFLEDKGRYQITLAVDKYVSIRQKL